MNKKISLRIGVSTRALFKLEKENTMLYEKGLKEYIKYNKKHEDKILEQGTAFRIVKNVLALNEYDDVDVQVILMSRACPEIATRVLKSIDYYGLQIEEAYFTGGDSLTKYVANSQLDLYLSTNEDDVKAVSECGIASGLINPNSTNCSNDTKGLRVAFDCDRVLFGSESDDFYESHTLEEYVDYEISKASEPIGDGLFKNLLIKLGKIQEKYGQSDENPIKIAICTARNYKVHERCLNTLNSWGIRVSQAFFCAGNNKAIALEAFNADIFFDDSSKNVKNASKVVPTCQVL